MDKNSTHKINNSETGPKAVMISVQGDVQGVSYRYFAKKEASKFSLAGWAQNEDDGTVALFVQGTEADIGKMIEWARVGSPMATVENIIVTERRPVHDLRGFEVK